jgi:hypothetical protein
MEMEMRHGAVGAQAIFERRREEKNEKAAIRNENSVSASGRAKAAA